MDAIATGRFSKLGRLGAYKSRLDGGICGLFEFDGLANNIQVISWYNVTELSGIFIDGDISFAGFHHLKSDIPTIGKIWVNWLQKTEIRPSILDGSCSSPQAAQVKNGLLQVQLYSSPQLFAEY